MTTEATTDPADMVRCIKTLLRDEKVEMVRHDSAVLSQRELAGPLANLMVRDPQGYDALVLTERPIVRVFRFHPWDQPEQQTFEPLSSYWFARSRRVTRRTILRWKARALRTLVADLLRVQ